MIDTSIIICAYNKAPQMIRGIESIFKQKNLPENTEIVFIDDGSTDNTKEVARELKKKSPFEFRYIYLDYPDPRISCNPRNVGIKHSRGKNIIFTEPEVLHMEDTIRMILKKLEDNPQKFPIATQVWSMGEKLFNNLKEDEWSNPKGLKDHPYAMLVEGNMTNTKAPDADWAFTGSMDCFVLCLGAIKKEYLEIAGGFDEELQGFGYDDWDLMNRLKELQHPYIMCNDIPVAHLPHPKVYGFNIYETTDKNGKISQENIEKGKLIANQNKDWGLII